VSGLQPPFGRNIGGTTWARLRRKITKKGAAGLGDTLFPIGFHMANIASCFTKTLLSLGYLRLPGVYYQNLTNSGDSFRWSLNSDIKDMKSQRRFWLSGSQSLHMDYVRY
jgi:hypothetical protein